VQSLASAQSSSLQHAGRNLLRLPKAAVAESRTSRRALSSTEYARMCSPTAVILSSRNSGLAAFGLNMCSRQLPEKAASISMRVSIRFILLRCSDSSSCHETNTTGCRARRAMPRNCSLRPPKFSAAKQEASLNASVDFPTPLLPKSAVKRPHGSQSGRSHCTSLPSTSEAFTASGKLSFLTSFIVEFLIRGGLDFGVHPLLKGILPCAGIGQHGADHRAGLSKRVSGNFLSPKLVFVYMVPMIVGSLE